MLLHGILYIFSLNKYFADMLDDWILKRLMKSVKTVLLNDFLKLK